VKEGVSNQRYMYVCIFVVTVFKFFLSVTGILNFSPVTITCKIYIFPLSENKFVLDNIY
jgi:hypothetical protein